MSGNALWSGRFDAAPDADVYAYGKSLPVDKRLIDDDITGSDAWARALGRAGVLSDADVTAITRGLEEIRAAVRATPALIDQADDEDVHSFVERELIARIGDTGKRLHTGRSRNEQVSVDFRLYLRRRSRCSSRTCGCRTRKCSAATANASRRPGTKPT